MPSKPKGTHPPILFSCRLRGLVTMTRCESCDLAGKCLAQVLAKKRGIPTWQLADGRVIPRPAMRPTPSKKSRVLTALAKGHRTLPEIAARVKLTESSALRQLSALYKSGEVECARGVWMLTYSLPG